MAGKAGGQKKAHYAGIPVRIMSDTLIADARICAKVESRSVGRQIEYWAKLGRLAIENPRLPIDVIRDTLISLDEAAAGQLYPLSSLETGEGK